MVAGSPGVARLDQYGYLRREIVLEIDQGALVRYGIAAGDVVAAIRNRNIRATGGSFESYTSEKNIVTLAQFERPEEVAEVIVRSDADGNVIRVGDVATLSDAFEPEKVRSRQNGKPGISYMVYKQQAADIIRTVRELRRRVGDFEARLPPGYEIVYTNDASRSVSNRLNVVMTNGMYGLVLVVMILALFLNLRIAIWVAMGIPVALLGTLFLLPMFGAYLDSIAMAAMILVIGIIVDDGTVLAESIWRQRELGASPLDAATNGTAAVFRPVLTTVITTALAFMPMLFMSGTLGDFIYVIPLVMVLALAVSFAEITVALPAHLISGARGRQAVVPAHKRNWFDRVRRGFEPLLGTLLRLRYAIVALSVVMLGSAFWYAARYMDFVLFPTQSSNTVFLTLEFPSGSSLDSTTEHLAKVEAIIAALPESELDSYVARIGSHSGINLGANENWAMLGIYLTPFADRDRNADQIVEGLRAQLEEIPWLTHFNFIIDSGGPGVGRPVTIRVTGSDDARRAALTTEVVRLLSGIDGVKDIDRDDKLGKEQIRIDLDYLRLADAGLTVADISRNVRLAYDGEIVTSVRYGEEDVGFRVILERAARASTEALHDLLIRNPQGRFIALREIASFHTEPGPSNVYHFDNQRSVTVTADIEKGRTTPLLVTELIARQVDVEKNWPGMRLVVGGEAEESQASMGSLTIAFAAAAIGIYLVLLLLFNSMIQPLAVMVAIPFGLVGVIFAFAVHRQAMGFLAMLGVIGLVGIVVNDELILVNLINLKRREQPELDIREIVVKATSDRLRPILLTSITTVAGLLPMACGIGGSDPFAEPMALAMGYGILFATPITLVLLPSMITIQGDLAGIGRAVLGKWRS